jgi:hypothetical protein
MSFHMSLDVNFVYGLILFPLVVPLFGIASGTIIIVQAARKEVTRRKASERHWISILRGIIYHYLGFWLTTVIIHAIATMLYVVLMIILP